MEWLEINEFTWQAVVGEAFGLMVKRRGDGRYDWFVLARTLPMLDGPGGELVCIKDGGEEDSPTLDEAKCSAINELWVLLEANAKRAKALLDEELDRARDNQEADMVRQWGEVVWSESQGDRFQVYRAQCNGRELTVLANNVGRFVTWSLDTVYGHALTFECPSVELAKQRAIAQAIRSPGPKRRWRVEVQNGGLKSLPAGTVEIEGEDERDALIRAALKLSWPPGFAARVKGKAVEIVGEEVVK